MALWKSGCSVAEVIVSRCEITVGRVSLRTFLQKRLGVEENEMLMVAQFDQ